MHRLRLAAALLAVLVLGAAPSAFAAGDPLKLGAGDVISITVAGFPELSQRAPIGIGGWLSSNLLGRVDASGLDLEELQGRMREGLAQRPYERSTNGRITVTRISPNALTLDIATYRPFYVTGDVAKPGEQAFRPGILVRQAITLAGGLDLLRGRMTELERMLDASDLRAEMVALSAKLTAQDAEIARLRTLLGQPGAAPAVAAGPEVPGTRFERQIETSAAHQTALAKAEIERRRTYQQAVSRQADEHLKVLRDRYQREVEGAETDFADYERIRSLFRSGTVANTRVSDARRAWQMAAGQSLQTLARINDVERELGKALQELADLDSKHQIGLEQGLTTALAERAATEARLASARAKMGHLAGARIPSRPLPGAAGVLMRIQRGSGVYSQTLPADESTELLPGDVLEIRMESEVLASLPR